MGSKNLKAIIANGSRAISISDPVRFKKVVNRIYQHVKAIPDRDEIINLGNMKGWNKWWEEGIPMKANTEMFPKWKATELYGPKIYLDKVKKGRASCPSCPLPDKEIMEVKEGEFKDLITFAGSFSGRVYNYGIRCGVGTYDRVIKIHDVANRLGICDHAFSSLYDFAVEVFDKGRITLKDTEGIVLKRDFETTLKVMELTAFRKGFGNILADGYHCFFERFGEDLKTEAIQAKGMDMLHEPRLGGLTPKAFIMVVNPRGGHHQPGLGTPSDSHSKNIDDFRVWCEKAGVPPDAMERIFFHPMKMNIARLAKHAQEFYTILSCLGICARGPIPRLYSLDDCAELYSSFKGIEISPVEMKKAGERVWNLYKMINVREGFERKDDLFPEKWLTPIKGEMGEKILMDYFETKNLTREDLQNLLDDYYDECGWDKIRGIPTEEKLKDLGLTQAIGDLRE
jgi:aldehyde:ferredoxin oxidoreductase